MRPQAAGTIAALTQRALAACRTLVASDQIRRPAAAFAPRTTAPKKAGHYDDSSKLLDGVALGPQHLQKAIGAD